jgi:hypothetical protein
LTTNDIRNIINLDLRKQTVGGRHQIGTLAGFRSEWAAGFVLECMAGFVGIRTPGSRKGSNRAEMSARSACIRRRVFRRAILALLYLAR